MLGIAVPLIFLAITTIKDTTEHTVLLTEDGFTPRNLVIQKGESVTFRTSSRKAFWPASNVHPTHSIYSAFDAKQPIRPSETWTFQFTQTGSWKYHDHVYPRAKGIIEVEPRFKKRTLSSRDIFSKNSNPVNCSSTADSSKKQQCWEENIIDLLETEGVDGAFERLSFLYDTEAVFRNDCHGYAHFIGEHAYGLFSQGENFSLSGKTSYCGFGFYHGFMETLLLTTGDAGKARAFCEFVDEQKFGQTNAAVTACYHGVGHGAVDGSDRGAWGNAQAMLAPGFLLCDLIAETSFQHYLCATGVFNALEILSTDPKYGLEDIQKEPFSVCYDQEPRFREACYTNMTPAVFRLKHGDFLEVARYVEENILEPEALTIENFTNHRMVLLSVFQEYFKRYGEEEGYIEDGLGLCRSLEERSLLPCIEGLSGGHLKYGDPANGYLRAIDFCSNSLLTEIERGTCFGYVVPRISTYYGMEIKREICVSLQKQHRYYCDP